LTGKEPLLPEEILLNLAEMDKLDKKLGQILNEKDVEARLASFKDYFSKTDFSANFKRINENPLSKDEEFQSITSNFSELLTLLNSQLLEAKQLLEQIYNLAKSITIPPSKPINFSQSDLMENRDTLAKIYGLLADLKSGKEFYSSLKPYADKLKSTVSQYCNLRDDQLLTVSRVFDPTSSNPLVSGGNPYKTLEESMRPQAEPDYQQLSTEEMDIGARWTSIRLTKSFMIDVDPNTWIPTAMRPPTKNDGQDSGK